METLNVVEIFCSVQGETSLAGLPTAFVRLAQCNLRCGYCDTPYSFGKGDPWTLDALVERIETYPVRHVCVTGGEPMLQKQAAVALMAALVDKDYVVSLETNGTVLLDTVPDAVIKVVDIKTPGALGASADDPKFRRTHLDRDNLGLLTGRDEVKFVITSRSDYEWSRDFARQHGLFERCGAVLFSPSWDEVAPSDMVDWILADRLPARLNLQIHKVIWGSDASGV